ncbi:hypothetical protein PR048_018318 [Dryococelus australis]|uniref:Uncharacterized protein n=1 Tax=Dryococelus australis TaxID=614101 RepID=A0ABQ9HBY0_9NEOP|nr:hypothetical protein PR048_018318 [Dryococelus australis]
MVSRTILPGREVYVVKLTLGFDSPPLTTNPSPSKCPPRSPNVGQTENGTQKRRHNENDWWTNIQKKNRNKGEGYISTKGKNIPAHEMKPQCTETCCLQCHTKYTQNQRLEIHNSFLTLGDVTKQHTFMVNSITKIEPTQKSMRKRANYFVYYLTVNNRKVRFCKTFFLNTLGLDELDTVGPDNRGKHSNHINKLEYITRDSQTHKILPRNRKPLLTSLSISQLHQLYKEKCSTANEIRAKEHTHESSILVAPCHHAWREDGGGEITGQEAPTELLMLKGKHCDPTVFIGMGSVTASD